MRKPLIAANWKMYKTISEADDFVKQFVPLVKDVTDVDKLIAPPFTSLNAVATAAAGSGIIVAAQDVFYEEQGAFTGEISPGM
ncbi:MAG: triose-phosphate isomerase, partial [Nitrospiraceae bacterium]|nr:triose-phosphate isomerase [Nitrospiraceae bacterium]